MWEITIILLAILFYTWIKLYIIFFEIDRKLSSIELDVEIIQGKIKNNTRSSV